MGDAVLYDERHHRTHLYLSLKEMTESLIEKTLSTAAVS
jgi:hypothetical protein